MEFCPAILQKTVAFFLTWIHQFPAWHYSTSGLVGNFPLAPSILGKLASSCVRDALSTSRSRAERSLEPQFRHPPFDRIAASETVTHKNLVTQRGDRRHTS